MSIKGSRNRVQNHQDDAENWLNIFGDKRKQKREKDKKREIYVGLSDHEPEKDGVAHEDNAA